MSYSNAERLNRSGINLSPKNKPAPNHVKSAQFNDIETAILRSMEPVEINETQEITYGNERGIWANRTEVLNWRGERPIDEYPLNYDANPQVVTKKSSHHLKYVQELAIRYLRPPTPEKPGDIIIKQLENEVIQPAPALIIRQQPAKPKTPEPLVIREQPPPMPKPVGKKIIIIGAKKPIPPPRKVVIERLPKLPSKPQSVIIERWLPYRPVKRRVVFQRGNSQGEIPSILKTKNVIIQWAPPDVQINKEFSYLGIDRVDPNEYIQKYGDNLKETTALPSFVNEIKTPNGIVLAADELKNKPRTFEYDLDGDIYALNYVDLDKEGLGEYKSYLKENKNISKTMENDWYSSSHDSVDVNTIEENSSVKTSNKTSDFFASSSESIKTTSDKQRRERKIVDRLIEQIFQIVDKSGVGQITKEDAQRTLTRINTRISKQFDERTVSDYFGALDTDFLNFESFRSAFIKLSDTGL